MNNTKIMNPILAAQVSHKYLGMFGMIWISLMVLTLLSAVKTINIFGMEYVVAIIAYPITYIFADIFTEVYGYRITRKIVWTGFFSLMLVAVLSYIYSIIPSSPSFNQNEAFDLIFKSAPVVVACFISGFFSGELVNSFVLAKLKIHYIGKYEQLRYVASTFFGQIVDNTIAFTGIYLLISNFYSIEILPTLIISSIIFCTSVEILMLPVTKRVVRFIKEKEGIDTYDVGTDFNPFKFG